MNKAVLVTGSSGGTGYAIAEKFASEGYAVMLTSRNESAAVKAAGRLTDKFGIFAKGYKLCGKVGDDVYDMFCDIRGMNYELKSLVLNAADLGMNMPVLTTELDLWRDVIETNICWNFMLAQQAAAQMRENGGTIVFIGSNTCKRAIKNRSAYIASKGGLLSLSRALAVELGEYGIRVNTVLSGSIKTSRWDGLDDNIKQMKCGRVPVRDIADFDDIANAVWFLSTGMSKNITGSEIVVDGGVNAQLFPGV